MLDESGASAQRGAHKVAVGASRPVQPVTASAGGLTVTVESVTYTAHFTQVGVAAGSGLPPEKLATASRQCPAPNNASADG